MGEYDFFIRCRTCRVQIGFTHEFIDTLIEDDTTAVLENACNVTVVTEEHYKQVNGSTVAETCCAKCHTLLGLKLISVPADPSPPTYVEEGRFLMKTDKLVNWDTIPMIQVIEQDGGANQPVNDQDGGGNEQDHDQVVDGIDPVKFLIGCRTCRVPIGFIYEFTDTLIDDDKTAVFEKAYNVTVGTEEHYKQVNGNIVADTCCAKCHMLLGLKLISVPADPSPPTYVEEGRFLMKTDKLVYWDNTPMNQVIEQDGGANDQQVNDQDGGAKKQVNDQDGGVTERDHGQDADQVADGMDNID